MITQSATTVPSIDCYTLCSINYNLPSNVKVRIEEISYCGESSRYEAVSNTDAEKRDILKWNSWERAYRIYLAEGEVFSTVQRRLHV